jgi:hypothetical protein
MFGADGLAFVDEFDAVLLGLLRTVTRRPGRDSRRSGPCGEDVAFADLARPVEDGNAGGVVLEDWDLVGAELNWHAGAWAGIHLIGKGEMLTLRWGDQTHLSFDSVVSDLPLKWLVTGFLNSPS